MFDFPIIGIIIVIALAFIVSLWPIWLAIKFFINLNKKKSDARGPNDFSPIDGGVQAFSVLSILFFWILVAKFNQMLAQPLQDYYILLFLAVVCFVICYYWRILSAAVLGIIMLFAGFNWHMFGGVFKGLLSGSSFSLFPVLSIYLFFALTFYLLGRWHDQEEKEKRLAKLYLVFSIILSTIILFVSTVRELPMLSGSLIDMPGIFVGYFVFFLVAVCIFAYFDLQKKKLLPMEFVFIAIMFLCFLSASLLGISGQLAILLSFITNALLLGQAVGVLIMGYYKREDWYINIGTVLVILTVMIKYFDWFSFLDKSLYFIGAGALFFFLGMFLDKTRKAILSGTKQIQ